MFIGHYMKRIRYNNLIKRTASILGSNEGASLVFVSILAIIVLTAVVVLRISVNSFLASANRQLNQDQAYEIAASLGESIDILVEKGDYDIFGVNVDSDAGKTIGKRVGFDNLPNASVEAVVTKLDEDDNARLLTVTSIVGNASYEYTKEYRR